MEVNPRLSLTLGVRWEYESFPGQQLPNSPLPQTATLPDNKTNFGPRVGFAYDLYGAEQTILRGGYGMFFARAINSTLYQALIGTGAAGSQTNPSSIRTRTCAPLFPQIVAALTTRPALAGAAAMRTAYYLDPNFKVPQIHQADLTLEQQVGNHDVFSLSWLGSWGRRLPDFVDTNLPAPTPVEFHDQRSDTSAGPLASGTTFNANVYFCRPRNPNHRPNPNFSSITDIFSGVTSNYEALVAQYKHQAVAHVSLRYATSPGRTLWIMAKTTRRAPARRRCSTHRTSAGTMATPTRTCPTGSWVYVRGAVAVACARAAGLPGERL